MIFSGLIYRAMGLFYRLTGKVAPTVYMEEIEQHFEKLFEVEDSTEHTVFHELASKYVHVDIHILAATEKRPYQVLFTTGMSDLPMTLPEEAEWDVRKTHERAELFCILPKEWKLSGHKNPEEAERCLWIVSALKKAARYPHMCKSWLGSGHSLQFTEDNQPFSDGTQMCAAVFIQSNDSDFDGKYGNDLGVLRTSDSSYINLLNFIPVYEDELNFKIENSADDLFMKLYGETLTDLSQLIINMNRENVCMNKII